MSNKAKRLVLCAAAAALLPATSALAWTKSYIVEWVEPALYYGAPEGGGAKTPGTDCPTGSNPRMDWVKELAAYGLRDTARLEEINSAEYPRNLFKTHFGFRGPNKDNVYENPTVVPDAGLVEVTGKLAEGFDLDGNPNTGFTGLDGTPGVDNAFYKTSGCILRFRGPQRRGAGIMFNNEAMQNGKWQTVVVMSGNGADPMNDADVTIGMYATSDKMVKDAGGKIAADYTFRIDPDPKFQSVFKAKITGGVVEQQKPFFFRTHDATMAEHYNTLSLYQTRLKWQVNADGSVGGLVGGYRDWYDTYMETAAGNQQYGNSIDASTREDLGHMNLSAWYYALRRNADGLPHPKTGKMRGISTVYRFSMTPAYVVSPNTNEAVRVARVY